MTKSSFLLLPEESLPDDGGILVRHIAHRAVHNQWEKEGWEKKRQSPTREKHCKGSTRSIYEKRTSADDSMTPVLLYMLEATFTTKIYDTVRGGGIGGVNIGP